VEKVLHLTCQKDRLGLGSKGKVREGVVDRSGTGGGRFWLGKHDDSAREPGGKEGPFHHIRGLDAGHRKGRRMVRPLSFTDHILPGFLTSSADSKLSRGMPTG
jgi:hypothetical protein